MGNNVAGKKNLHVWPALPYEEWEDTYETLHMWMQIVGKVKLVLSPFLNEWWEVAFYVTARGMTTGTIPYKERVFQVDFDFIHHTLSIFVSDGRSQTMQLAPQSVSMFYQSFLSALQSFGIQVKINTKPVETENTIPFEKDSIHASYNPEQVHRFFQILVQVEKVFQKFRSSFFGKSSPVHFFWGSFDLAETRFSGRPAPLRKEANKMMRISMDQEEMSFGFWPGSGKIKTPAFYSYTYPEPSGYKDAKVKPKAAFYDTNLGEFLLKYDDVRQAASPEKTLLEFLQSTYEVGSTLAHWDRATLERDPVKIDSKENWKSTPK